MFEPFPMEWMKQLLTVTNVDVRFRISNWYMAGFLISVGQSHLSILYGCFIGYVTGLVEIL